MKKLNILFIETFYGGSHKAFADAFNKFSQHNITMLTLPDNNWKWKIRLSALTIWEKIKASPSLQPDIIISGGMTSLCDLKALTETKAKIVLYAHEMQIAYPQPDKNKTDYSILLPDLKNMLIAEHIFFNSEFHMNTAVSNMKNMVEEISRTEPGFNFFPEEILKKSSIIYPGIKSSELKQIPGYTEKSAAGNHIPVILWNHRWEYDKNPGLFFSILKELKEEGLKFRLIVSGESSQLVPKYFTEAETLFKDELIHFGCCESREKYIKLMKESDIVISTSYQENFGISICEAVACGAFPLLPLRLAYPEVLPKNTHAASIYRGRKDLKSRLRLLLKQQVKLNSQSVSLCGSTTDMQQLSSIFLEKYDVEKSIKTMDKAIYALYNRD